ncbi:streptophobe family protein [Streptacidiphilus cavernicola]|uniref:Streptophobe family protein n=1 Tax=Streptacidiphilus cavernicola TaxID=3342716 RepID=A0ABV6W111_9ACTN
MTGYGQQASATSAGGLRGGGLRGGAVYGLVSAAVAASWAFVAMGAVTALGIHLLGLDHYASIGPMTAAMVAMAVGGRISPSGDVSVFGMDAASANGAIGIIPLGVGLVGALVLGWLFVRPLYRLPVLEPGQLAARVGGAALAFLILLGVLAWAGNGAVAVKVGSLTGGGGGSGGSGGGDPLGGLTGLLGDGGSGGSGSGGDPLGGLTGTLGGVLGDNTNPTVGFKVDLAPTLGLGLLWVLVVLALALAASRRCPLPLGWDGLRRGVRPAASAVVTVLVGAVLVGALAGIVVGLTGNGGAKTVGGVLLATPNGVFLAVLLGMAVPLNGKASGPLSGFLPSPVNTLLKGGGGQDITLSSLGRLDGRVWLLPVAVALMLLTVGVFAAVRTPRPVLPRSAVWEAGAAGLRLGVAMAVVTPVLLVLASVSVNANLSVFGFDAVGAGLSISGNALLAVLLGLVEGAVFGFLGSLLVSAFPNASAKRVALEPRPSWADGPGSDRTGLDPRPAYPPRQYPAEAPTQVYGQQSPPQPGYGGLPQTPSAPGAPPQQANPYRTPGGNPQAAPPPPPMPPGPRSGPAGAPGPGQGGYNPYSGGPAQTPPPPTAPPGR